MNNVLVDLFSDFQPEAEDQEKDYKIFWRDIEYHGTGIHMLLTSLYAEQMRRYQSEEENLSDPVVIVFDTGEVCSFFVFEIVDKIENKCYSKIRWLMNRRISKLMKSPWKIEELLIKEAARYICDG